MIGRRPFRTLHKTSESNEWHDVCGQNRVPHCENVGLEVISFLIGLDDFLSHRNPAPH